MRGKLLLIVSMIAVLVGLALAHATTVPVSAHAPHPGLNIWIGVSGVPNCDTQDGDTSCDLAPGTPFVVEAHLDPLPSDIAPYGGYDVNLSYSGVTANNDVSTDAWPDCGFPAKADPQEPGKIVYACAVSFDAGGGSTYSGVIGTNSYVCAQSGNVTLNNGPGSTDLIEFDNIANIHAEGTDTETLTINCVTGGEEPPIPTAVSPGSRPTLTDDSTPLEPTAAAIATTTAQSQATATARAAGTATTKTPTGTNAGNKSDDDGLNTWVIVAIIAGGVAAAVVVGGGAWWYMQNRGAASGGPPAT